MIKNATNMNTNTTTIRFFEGSDLFKTMDVITPSTTTQLYSGILTELNIQFRYRPTNQSLWAEIKDGDKVIRITRILKASAKIVEFNNNEKTEHTFSLQPGEEYLFTGLAS
jgi:hypothetical protein